jgi:hypothetical protein
MYRAEGPYLDNYNNATIERRGEVVGDAISIEVEEEKKEDGCQSPNIIY